MVQPHGVSVFYLVLRRRTRASTQVEVLSVTGSTLQKPKDDDDWRTYKRSKGFTAPTPRDTYETHKKKEHDTHWSWSRPSQSPDGMPWEVEGRTTWKRFLLMSQEGDDASALFDVFLFLFPRLLTTLMILTT